MFGFWKKELPPTVESPVEPKDTLAMRERELVSQLHTVDHQRQLLAIEVQNFRKASTAVVDSRPVYLSDRITARRELDSRWNELLRERNRILKTLSEIRCPVFGKLPWQLTE